MGGPISVITLSSSAGGPLFIISGRAPARDFSDVLLTGLAEDGGLFMPESWPHFSPADWRAMRALPYHALAARIMQPFVGTSIPAAVPYIRGDATRVNAWQARLGAAQKPRVGLAWSGSLVLRDACMVLGLAVH